MTTGEGHFDQEPSDTENLTERSVREFEFYPEIEGDRPPIKVTVVGSPEDSVERQKELLGIIVAEKTAKRMKAIIDSGKKVLWNMATGSTFKWPECLPNAMAGAQVDPNDVIPIVKEDVFDAHGKHYPPGHPYDFRGRRTESFHQLFGLDPENVSVDTEGQIDGNIVAPGYDMSPEQSVEYMNTTYQALKESGQVIGLTTTGVGEDMHVGEMQINRMNTESMLRQRDFFLQPVENYSRERGLFKWLQQEQSFYSHGNSYVKKSDEGWVSAGRGSEFGEEISGIQVMGMGWREMFDSPGGAIFAFDSGKKSLAARSALEGSFSGSFKNKEGQTVAHLDSKHGEGGEVFQELSDFVDKLVEEGVLDVDFKKQDQHKPRIAESGEAVIDPGLIDRILRTIYGTYEKKNISPSDPEIEQKYFQPIWKIVNRYLGMRSPVALWVRELYRRNTPIEMVLTREAAKELPL